MMVRVQKNPGSGSTWDEELNAAMHCKHVNINSGRVLDAGNIEVQAPC
jgi:hypothetical protein